MENAENKRLGLRTIFSVIAQNWSVLICFEIIYKAVGISFFFPLLGSLARRLPGLIRADYLSQENFSKIFGSPAAVFMLVCAGFMLAAYLYFEIIALTIYSEKGWSKEAITVWKLIRLSFKEIVSMFRLKRIASFLLLLIMPLSFFGASSVFLRPLQIPEFILTAITENTLYVWLLAGAVILVNYLFFLYLFGFPTLFLTNCSFKESWKESLGLLRGKKIRTVGRMLFYVLAFLAGLCVAWMAGVGVIAGAARIFHGVSEGKLQFSIDYDTFTGVWNLVSGALLSVFFCAMAVVLYHRCRGDNRPEEVKKPWTIKHMIFRFAITLALIAALMFVGDTELSRQIFNGDRSNVAVVAHRAGAIFAPENTVAALKQAILDEADMAEIDVQQIKDGTLVVLHDTNFKRTTGVNLNVWDANYDQVKELDAGKSHFAEYAGEPIPVLEDMLKAAKGKIDLMIELKATGHEKSLVEDTLALIEKNDMEQQCNIASMDFNLLKQVKSMNPEIKTTYISVLLVPESYDLKQIDCYSVETTFLSREFVYQAHEQGKLVYGWTASSDESIKKVLGYETDGIVTDNPLLVRYNVDTLDEDFLKEALEEFFF